MIRITNIHFILPTAPNPGNKYRLIMGGEVGCPGDDYFDPEDGQWKPDPDVDTTTPFDPAIHAPARRLKGPVYKPYDMESIPLPLVVQSIGTTCRDTVFRAEPDTLCFGWRNAITYRTLLELYTHDDGTPCGIRVSE